MVHFLSLLLRFVGTIILTRVFSPEVFGVLAIVMSVQLVISLLTDIGLRQAIIQSPRGDVPSFLHTAFTLQILRGFFIWGIGGLFAVGLLLASEHAAFPPNSAYAYPGLPLFLFVSTFSSVILGFQSMKAVHVARHLDLKWINLTELAAQFASLAFVIFFGWLTRSIWSYVLGQLLSSVIISVCSYLVLKGPRDRFGWSSEASKELFRFGKWTILSSTISALAQNGDRLLLGVWLNSASLGFYSVACNLVSIPDGVVGRLLGAVFFPALSQTARSDVNRVPDILYKMRGVTDTLLLAVSGFLFSAAPTIVHWLYDPRYEPIGWMLQYLSLGLILSRYSIFQQVYLALGRPEYLPIVSVAKLVSLFSAIFLLNLLFGIHGAVLGVATHMVPSCALMIYLNRRHNVNNVQFEMAITSAWLAGWLIGEGIALIH